MTGDLVVALNGTVPRDVIEWQQLVDEADLELDIERGGLSSTVHIQKRAGEPLGAEVDSALFDRVRTCDNHCDFCFIYQLPKGMRRSLYLKDDDYRLSFLYGNFTTLTRFTESDLERVITERLSPLYVSIHATDPDVRADLLSNRRGAMSLRWLRAILDEGIDVHGQIVVCPGINNGDVLEATLAGIADEYPELATLAVVPLGISDHAPKNRLRLHTVDEAVEVVRIVERWQEIFLDLFGRRMVHASDEYHLLAGLPFPEPEVYGDFSLHEDGVGMARNFELEFDGHKTDATGVANGFFAWVEGAPADGYRAPRTADGAGRGAAAGAGTASAVAVTIGAKPDPAPPVVDERPIGILTGPLGAMVIEPLVDSLDRDDVRVIPVENRFFGGNVGVTGLMVGEDLQRALADEPAGHRYLLPDVCLSNGQFLDGLTIDDLPHEVEVLTTDGIALRAALNPAPAGV